MSEFDQFWEKYPRRVGKLDAMRAFEKARKMASLAEILEGIDLYMATKPEYADYCHPSTWLNKGRWMDEPDRRSGDDRRVSKAGIEIDCPHQPRCLARWQCGQKQLADRKVG